MFVRGGKLLVVLALVLATGLHWAALQTVAWTTMLAANWTTGSFSMAVSNTFDGQHLCPLCRAIAAAKKSEQKREFTSAMLKLEFPPVADKIVLIPAKPFSTRSATDTFADSSFPRPPVPPPRSRFV
jgi:hypothetical protein